MHGYGRVFIEFEHIRKILYKGFFTHNILADWLDVEETAYIFIINESIYSYILKFKQDEIIKIIASP